MEYLNAAAIGLACGVVPGVSILVADHFDGFAAFFVGVMTYILGMALLIALLGILYLPNNQILSLIY